MRHKLYLIVLGIISLSAYAQPYANATLDRDTILIGEQAILSLTISKGEQQRIYWPPIPNELGIPGRPSLEVLGSSKIDTIVKGTDSTFTLHLNITAFDSGVYSIPPFLFGMSMAGKVDTVSTPLLNLWINTVEVDTAAAPKPIKDPLNTPFSFAELKTLFIILAIIWVLVIIAGVIYVRFFRKKKVVSEPLQPSIPPYELASKRIRELDEKKLWKQGLVKEYYSELSEIIREYIEGRFMLSALEETTYNILKSMEHKLPESIRESLQDVLTASDLVKFAKGDPLPDEHMKAMRQAMDFLLKTKPAESLHHE